MKYRVIVTPTADAEAMEAFRWYAARSPAAAAKWHAGLMRALHGLTEDPSRFPVSPEDSDALGCEARIYRYGRRRGIFRILYHVSGNTVTVLRIRHGAQGPIEP